MPVTCAALHSVASELHSVAPDLQSVAPVCGKLQQIAVKQSVIIAPPSHHAPPPPGNPPSLHSPLAKEGNPKSTLVAPERSAAQEESAMDRYLFVTVTFRYLSSDH